MRQNKATNIFKDQSLQVSFSGSSLDLHFRLGLSLVCETGGKSLTEHWQ